MLVARFDEQNVLQARDETKTLAVSVHFSEFVCDVTLAAFIYSGVKAMELLRINRKRYTIIFKLDNDDGPWIIQLKPGAVRRYNSKAQPARNEYDYCMSTVGSTLRLQMHNG